MIRSAADAVGRITGALGLELPETGKVLRREMRPHLPDAPVILEAGAHIGLDTLAMSRLWRNGVIHALEPVPDLYAKLSARCGRRANVRLYEEALSVRNGSMTMYVSGGASDGSSSLLPPLRHLDLHPDVTFARSIEVPTVTLDTWRERERVDRVDFLWLDAQGGEFDILRGGQKTLETVQALYLEVSLLEGYSGAAMYEELRTWLGEKGFVPTIERIPWAEGGNVFFTRSGVA